MQNFVDSEPITQVIKEKFVEYEELVAEIENLPDSHIVGPIQISMGNKLIFFFLIVMTFIRMIFNSLISFDEINYFISFRREIEIRISS